MYTSQAIVTRYLGATNHRGARIKATCDRGSITISYPYDKSGAECHREAVEALVARFDAEDVEKYGSPDAAHWGGLNWVAGGLPQSSRDGYAFVVVYENQD